MKTEILKVFGILLLSLFFACKKDGTSLAEELDKKNVNVEKAYPEKKGELKTAYFNGQLITYYKIEGENVFQGDIILPDNELSQTQKSTEGTGVSSSSGRRWKNKKVYYNIDPALADQSRVTNAIAHWEQKTNLDFVVRTNQSDYITFRSSSGCSSSIGRVGGRQYINLGPGCSTGNTIHEIGHAVGLFHEHSRTDRDNYVIIDYDNIEPGLEHNFNTFLDEGMSGFNYSGGLDFGSIMMYGAYFFAVDPDIPTITKLDGSTYLVQRRALSKRDIATINYMYP